MSTLPDDPAPADRPEPASLPGASSALLLLLSINLFNYIDRQVLSAVLPKLKFDADLFDPSDYFLQTKLGSLTTAFMVSYMILAPWFGRLGDRLGRWRLVGMGVIAWSLASGGSGLAATFVLLLATRCLVGVGEAAYGPVAPSMLSDLYPVNRRGRILSYFYLAIPVGSALGFVIGGQVAENFGWRMAFLVTLPPGILLGILALRMPEPPRRSKPLPGKGLNYRELLKRLWKIPSWQLCTLGMTASTFFLGGLAAFMPLYIFERETRLAMPPAAIDRLEEKVNSEKQPFYPPGVIAKLRQHASDDVTSYGEMMANLREWLTEAEFRQHGANVAETLNTPDSMSLGRVTFLFGLIVVVGGLTATLAGGWLGDALRGRVFGAYFLVCGVAMLASFPLFLSTLFVPFPLGWVLLFFAVFGLFLNTGPANAILANSVPGTFRASAFAINIFIIHAFGDAVSPVLIGFMADQTSLQLTFVLMSFFILLAGFWWLVGIPYLQADTLAAEAEERA